MTVKSRIRNIRTTLANLTTAIAANNLLSGEMFLITDSSPVRPAIGTSTNTYVDLQPYNANTAFLSSSQSWSAPQLSTIATATSANTITLDANTAQDWSLTLAHNATLANPTNIASRVGQKGSISGAQNGTGNFTLSYDTYWFPIGSNTAPAIPVAANAKFRLDYHIVSSTRIDFLVQSVGT